MRALNAQNGYIRVFSVLHLYEYVAFLAIFIFPFSVPNIISNSDSKLLLYFVCLLVHHILKLYGKIYGGYTSCMANMVRTDGAGLLLI